MTVKLNESFKRRVDRGDKRPLVGAMYDTFKAEFLLGGACQLVSQLITVLSPFVLRYLIKFAAEAYYASKFGRPAPSIARGIGLVIGITVLQIIQSTCSNQFLYRGMMNGGQARAVLIAVIFDKALRISGRAKAGGKPLDAPPPDVKPGSEAEKKWYKKILKKKGGKGPKGKGGDDDHQGWGNGRIINLMSTDTYRVDQASGMFHIIWTSPIGILLTLILLIVNLGYSALAGFGLLALTTPLLGRAIRSLFRRRAKINKITDDRVSLTNEVLHAVRFVKYFGWETSFLGRIAAIRKREIRSIQALQSIRNGIMAVAMSMPVFASMLAFITYSLSNHVLNPAPIFSSLALFNSLRLPLNLLPMVLGQVVDALQSIDRIQNFLLAEEVKDEVEWDYGNKNAIVLEHADFTWERSIAQEQDKPQGKGSRGGKGPKGFVQKRKDKKADKKAREDATKAGHDGEKTGIDSASTLTEQEPFRLHDLSFTAGRNELIAIIGSVGSGKTSVLAALAGDMRRTAGREVLGASRAFCPQSAWIQNATVKQNIVFGREFRDKWYNKVVDACALRPDLEMLPAGDLTEIGERGITVSGGQKQRLNIARAIYFDADIVLMDDPLSAVDAHVGRHIMDNAICGLLKDKCRILATHQLWVLNRCDRIIWMNEGRIEAFDTFDNLMEHNEGFAKLMATTSVEEEQEEEEHVNDDEVEEEAKVQKKKRGKKPAAALMQTEERAVKSVSWDVWNAYFKASGTILVVPICLLLLILSQGANIVTSLWLSWWTSNKFGFSEGKYVSLRSPSMLCPN